MNQNELLRIQKSFVCLGNDLDLNGDFLNILQEEKVLTFNHIEKIKRVSRNDGNKSAVIEFVNILKRRPNAYEGFLKALNLTNQTHIAEKVSGREQASSIQGFIPRLIERSEEYQQRIDQDDMDFDVYPVNLEDPYLRKVASGDKGYPINHNIRGRCIILDNKDFGNGVRNISSRDGEHMRRLFDYLGFDVKYYENLTTAEIRSMIIEESGKDELKNHDMFVMVTLSYGPENDRSIYGIDKGLVALDATIEDQFNGRLAPNLIGKPKLFITRILINDQVNDTDVTDTAVTHPIRSHTSVPPTSQAGMIIPAQMENENAHFLKILAKIDHSNGSRVYSDAKGSSFIRTFVRQVASKSCTTHMSDIITEVNGELRARLGESADSAQQPTSHGATISTTLLKSLYLLPGYNPES